MTEHKCAWKCAYMGCDWWIATGPGFKPEGEEIERRTMVGDYELSIANGDDVRRDMHAALNTIRRRFSLPMPAGAVEAFNTHVESERLRTLAMCSEKGVDLDAIGFVSRPSTPVTDRYGA